MGALRVLIAASLIMLAAITLLAIYLHFGDLNRHRSTVAALVSDTIGREFAIDGELDLELWPRVELAVGEMRLANAHWSQTPDMLSVDWLLLRFRARSLLADTFRLELLQLGGVNALLETDATGQRNWRFETGADESPQEVASTSSGLPFTLQTAEIDDIVVTMRESGLPERQLRLHKLDIARVDDGRTIDGTGTVFSQPLKISGFLRADPERGDDAGSLHIDGSLGALGLTIDAALAGRNGIIVESLNAEVSTDDVAPLVSAAGSTLPLSGPLRVQTKMAPQDDGIRLSSEGELGELGTRGELHLQQERIVVRQSVSSLAAAGELFGVPDLPATPAALSADVSFSGQSLEINQLELTGGKSGIEARASGTVNRRDGYATLTVQANVPSLADIDPELPAVPLDLDSRVELDLDQTRLRIDDLKATIGDSDISGNVTLDRQPVFRLTADLKSQKVNLEQLTAAEPGEGSQAPDEPGNARRWVFQPSPLPFERLRELEASLSWHIETLARGEIRLTPFVVEGTANGGKINLQTRQRGNYGGEAHTDITLDASTAKAQLEARVRARDMRVNLASGGAKREEIPTVSVSADLRSTGRSPRELASTANGRILFTQGPGKINNTVVSTVSGDLFSQLFEALNPLAETDEYSNWECSLALIAIDKGMATLDPLVLQGEKVMITGGGTVDLGQETLRLEFNTKPRKGIGISADMFITPFVALKGSLAEPSIGLNKKGTLLTGGAAVVTGGLSLLVTAAADRLGGSVDHCEKTLPEYPHPEANAGN